MTWQNIPQELKEQSRWVLWRVQTRKGKATKTPINAEGRPANALASENWLSFEEALRAAEKNRAGIGFVLGCGFVGVDLDNCLQNGVMRQWAKGLLNLLPPTYGEVSPSGAGVKLFYLCHADGLKIGSHRASVGVFSQGRYFAVTGEKLPDLPSGVTEISTETLKWLTQNLPIVDVAAKIEAGDFGPELQALFLGDTSQYPSHSEGDLAFISLVASRCGLRKPEELDFLFRLSALYRPKWDERHSADGKTYAEMTTQKALGNAKPPTPKAPNNPPGPLILPVLPLTKAVEKLKTLGEGSWLIEKLLPERGFAIFASRPKLGKTDTLLRVIANILLEKPCFGRKVQPVKVLWITQEDSLLRLQEGLLGHGVDPGTLTEKCLVVDYSQASGLISGEALLSTAREYRCQLVILEPLAALAELATLGRKDRLSYEAIYGVLNPLALKAKQTGVCLLGVWHSSRGKTRLASVEDVIDAPMGSTAYSAVADSILALGLPPDTADPRLRRIMAVGRGVQLDYLLQWDGTGYQEVGEFTGEEALSEGQRKLLGLLRVLGEATPSQLAAALGENRSTVKTWLWRLAQKGLVVPQGGGYRIAFHSTVETYQPTCGTTETIETIETTETGETSETTETAETTETVSGGFKRVKPASALQPQGLRGTVSTVSAVSPTCNPKQATWEGTLNDYLRGLGKT